MASKMLPYGRQTIDEDDIAAVLDVLKSDWLTTGPKVELFEEELKKATGATHAIACSNGTSALHLAALAAGLGPGDYAIVPAITFLATANAVRMTGANVVFADVDPNTGLVTPQTLMAALHRVPDGTAKAAFVVHLAGQVCDMAGLSEVTRTHNMTIIEDSCHALGSRYGQYGLDKAGDCKFGDIATFSFHPVKTITTGEGGAITTNNPLYADMMRKLRSHGMEKDPQTFKVPQQAHERDGSVKPWYYEMSSLGYNYRLSDIQCALGIAQLRKLDTFVDKRQKLVARYREKLKGISPLIKPVPKAAFTTPSWHLMVILVDWSSLNINRTSLMQKLKQQGILTQVHYIPVYQQPYYRKLVRNMTLDGAELYYEHCLSLPLFPDMTNADVDHVIECLIKCIPALSENTTP